KEVIDHVKALLAPRPIHRRDVDDAPELAAFVVTQKSYDRDDIGRGGKDGEFAVRNAMIEHRARQRGGDDSAEFVKCFVHCLTSVTARWCRRGGFSSAAAARRRAEPRRWAG